MNYFKRILVFTGILSLIIHFSFVLLFCFSGYVTNSLLLNLTIRYVFPVFNQNWRLFAPQPPLGNKYFYYKCNFSDNSTSPWIRSGEELLKKHKSALFWNYGKQFYIAQSIPLELSYLETEVKSQLKNEKVKSDSLEIERDDRMRKSQQYHKAIDFFSNNAAIKFPNKKK